MKTLNKCLVQCRSSVNKFNHYMIIIIVNTVCVISCSYPGHLSEVCVHVLVADWNHLSDAFIVTGEKHKQSNHLKVLIQACRYLTNNNLHDSAAPTETLQLCISLSQYLNTVLLLSMQLYLYLHTHSSTIFLYVEISFA